MTRPPVLIVLLAILGWCMGWAWPSLGVALEPLGTLFIQAIKMIVIPLVFSTVALGAYEMSRQSRQLGTMALIAAGVFLSATLIAALTGIALNFLFHPGLGLALPGPGPVPGELALIIDWRKYLLELIPPNVIAAMAEQKVLPTLIFSVAFGSCLGRLGPQARPITELLETLARAMLLLTRWIVAAAPLAMFALMARLAATQEDATLLALTKLVGTMYLGVAVMALFFLATLRVAGEQPLKILRVIREPLLLAFVTRSMEVAFPLQLQRLEDLAVPNRIAAIILPLGYSFNLTGSTMYVALACTFVADVYKIHLDIGALSTVLIVTLVASKGIANVPAGALVALSTVLVTLNLPVGAIAIITAVDVFLDMGRTGVNFLGNTVAVLLVKKIAGVSD
jgi:dicarboxylate/amino acid:cation (Na+ or H+) symporter, DAACS family